MRHHPTNGYKSLVAIDEGVIDTFVYSTRPRPSGVMRGKQAAKTLHGLSLEHRDHDRERLQ
jgi:hypothetical protein